MTGFYYNKQIKRYLIQFMQIFNALKVSTGRAGDTESDLLDVPIHYGSMDRVAAALYAQNTQNKPIRVPTMSLMVTGLSLNIPYMAGMNQTYSQTYMPEQGFFANDVRTVERLRPVPYKLTVDLSIWVSNTDQQFQLLEQILMLFSPNLQIQLSDDKFDWTKITVVDLESIRMEENYPIGNTSRVITTTLSFGIPIYLSAPADVREEFVRDIMMRIGTIDRMDNFDDILDKMTDLGFEYENVASADDIVNRTK